MARPPTASMMPPSATRALDNELRRMRPLYSVAVAVLYEQITIQYGIGRYAPRYGGSMHATITKSGTQSAGEGSGF